jgi:hypothetical protein
MAKKRTTKEEKRLKKKKRSKQLLPVPQQMIDRVKERGDAYVIDPSGEARMSVYNLLFETTIERLFQRRLQAAKTSSNTLFSQSIVSPAPTKQPDSSV